MEPVNNGGAPVYKESIKQAMARWDNRQVWVLVAGGTGLLYGLVKNNLLQGMIGGAATAATAELAVSILTVLDL